MADDYPRLLVDRDVVVIRGLMVVVQGSRRDTYPSGMARDMGGGMQVSVLRPGLRGRREDLVRTLDDAPTDQLGTVDEQRASAEAWRAERMAWLGRA